MKNLTVVFFFISTLLSAQNFELVPYRIKNKWGFSDSLGNIKIPVKYDNVRPFNRKYTAFQIKNKWGFIDITGKKIVKAKYDSVGRYFQGFFVVDKSTNKEIVKAGIKVYQNGKINYVGINGENLYEKEEGPGVIMIVDDDGYSNLYMNKIELVRKGKLVGYKIKKTGFSIEPQYDSLIYSDTDVGFYRDRPKAYFFANKKGKWGIISTSNKIILPFEYDVILEREFNDRKLFKKDDKWGVLDRDLKIILNNIYDSIAVNIGYLVQLNYQWGVLNYNFKEIVPIKYSKIALSDDDEGYYLWNSEHKVGFANLKGEIVIPIEFNYLNKYKYKDSFAYKDNKTDNLIGYLSADKKIIISVKYRSIAPFENGYSLVVNKKGREGYINEKGFEFFKK